MKHLDKAREITGHYFALPDINDAIAAALDEAVEEERSACMKQIRAMAFTFRAETGDMYQDNENEAARNALCAAIEAISARGNVAG